MKAIADNANLVGYAVADKIVGKAAWSFCARTAWK